MALPSRRTPKNYDGTGITTRRVGEVLPAVLAKLGGAFKDRPDLILASWPEIIGPKLASMTHAESFKDGILIVKVKNSTLHSLLNQYEKSKVLASLRQKFPKVNIINVIFRIS
jgi:hypothetical protein